MCGLEDSDPGIVVDVGTRSDADAANLSSEGIGDVVAVEVHRSQHAVLAGPSQHLLEHSIGDDVLDGDLSVGSRVGHGAPRSAV